MFNDTYDHIREIERLMRQIPNFRPRGYGVYIFSKFEYTAKDCDCRYCLHYRKGYGCTEDQCPYMKERITAGVPLWRGADRNTLLRRSFYIPTSAHPIH